MVPPALSSQQQPPDLVDALRVQPVRRLVEDQQPRSAHQGGGQPEPLAHAQRVGPGRPPVGGVEAHLVEHLGDPSTPHGARAAIRGRWRRGGRGWPIPRGAGSPRSLDEGADLGQHRRAGRPASAGPAPRPPGRRQHQPEQHPHRRGLARAVRAEEAVDVALARRRGRSPSTARSSPVALGQARVRITGPSLTARQQLGAARLEDVGGHGAGEQEAAARPRSRDQHTDGSHRGQGAGAGLPRRTAPAAVPATDRRPTAQRQGDQGGRAAPVDADRARVVPGPGGETRQRRRQVEGRERVGGRRDVDGVLVARGSCPAAGLNAVVAGRAGRSSSTSSVVSTGRALAARRTPPPVAAGRWPGQPRGRRGRRW